MTHKEKEWNVAGKLFQQRCENGSERRQSRLSIWIRIFLVIYNKNPNINSFKWNRNSWGYSHRAGFFQVLLWLLSEWPRLGFSLSISFLHLLSLKFMFSSAISLWFQDGCPHLQGQHSVHMQKSRVYLFSQWWNWRLGLHFDLILSPVLIPETILLWPDGWGFTRHTSRDRKEVSFPKALGCEVEKLVSEPKLGYCIQNRGWMLSSPKW